MPVRVVPCTREKVLPAHGQSQIAAQDAYKHPAFPRWRAWAEAGGTPWYVLSTMYGFVRHDAPMGTDYDRPVSEAREDEAFLGLLARQADDLGLAPAGGILVADWRAFVALARRALPRTIPVALVTVTGRYDRR